MLYDIVYPKVCMVSGVHYAYWLLVEPGVLMQVGSYLETDSNEQEKKKS